MADVDTRYADENDHHHRQNGYSDDDDELNNNEVVDDKVDPTKLLEMAFHEVPDAKSRNPNARRGQVKVSITGGGDFKGLHVSDEKVSDFKSVLKNKNVTQERTSSRALADKPEWAGQARRIDVARLETQRKTNEPGEKAPEWAGRLKTTGRIAELENRKPTQSNPSTPPWANLAGKSRKLPDAEAKSKFGPSDAPEWAGKPQLRSVRTEPKPRLSEEKPTFTKANLKSSMSNDRSKKDDSAADRNGEAEPEIELGVASDSVRDSSPEPEPHEEEAPSRSLQSGRPADGNEDDDSSSGGSRHSRRNPDADKEQEDASSHNRRTNRLPKGEGPQDEDDETAARRRARRARRRGVDDDE